MIRLDKNSNADMIVVTLSESSTLTNPYYLFVFINDTTRDRKNIVISSDYDLSSNKERYNMFLIDTAEEFKDLPAGDYTYIVYEQDSLIPFQTGFDYFFDIPLADSGNTDVVVGDLTLYEIENGKAQIIGPVKQFLENDIEITFIQNNG
jgi:hypothetical protein